MNIATNLDRCFEFEQRGLIEEDLARPDAEHADLFFKEHASAFDKLLDNSSHVVLAFFEPPHCLIIISKYLFL